MLMTRTGHVLCRETDVNVSADTSYYSLFASLCFSICFMSVCESCPLVVEWISSARDVPGFDAIDCVQC